MVNPTHGVVLPVMGPGWAGTVTTVVASVLEDPLPQPFDGTTVIFPDPAPTVAVTEYVVPPPVCIQPAGKVQV